MEERIPVARPYLGQEEADEVARVLESRWVTQGPTVEAFEEAFARRVGAREGVAVSSGTTALHLALLALGVGRGHEVLVPSYSFVATAAVVSHCGATPRFVDIDPRSYNMDPALVEGAITPATRAIMPVHQVGVPADMATITEVARAHGLSVVEDSACAVGSTLDGKPIGAPHGDISCFSFHPRKILTTGDGGMITLNDPEMALRLRRLRQHDLPRLELLAYNFRMSDIHAAVGLAQLHRLDEMLRVRQAQARSYTEAFSGVEGLEPPWCPPKATVNHQSYQLRLTGPLSGLRDPLMAFLDEQGIATRGGITAIHRLSMFAHHPQGDLPETERAEEEVLILPLYHEMTDRELQRVIQGVLQGIEELRKDGHEITR